MEAEARLLAIIFEKIFLDVINPFMAPSTLLFEAIVIMIETPIIFLLLERQVVKAFVASFTANLVTGLLSVFYIVFSWEYVSFTYSKLASMNRPQMYSESTSSRNFQFIKFPYYLDA